MDDKKVAALAQEIDFIKDDKIRNFAKVAVSSLPDYFFEVAASSTGKYHPSYALGEGGLLRHTKAAVRIANDLLSLEMYGSYSQMEKRHYDTWSYSARWTQAWRNTKSIHYCRTSYCMRVLGKRYSSLESISLLCSGGIAV